MSVKDTFTYHWKKLIVDLLSLVPASLLADIFYFTDMLMSF